MYGISLCLTDSLQLYELHSPITSDHTRQDTSRFSVCLSLPHIRGTSCEPNGCSNAIAARRQSQSRRRAARTSSGQRATGRARLSEHRIMLRTALNSRHHTHASELTHQPASLECRRPHHQSHHPSHIIHHP